MLTNEITRNSANALEMQAELSTQETISRMMQTIEDVMFKVVDNNVVVLRDASKHILEAGGKRVRPRLVALSYLACGGEAIDHIAPVAAALEMVHTASVVHDDINDHGVLRRGRPSVNAVWGRTFALLTGDYLFTKVYELMAPYNDLNIIFAEATTALVEGETLQASAIKEKNLTSEVYLKIIALKTAALFKAGAILGAKLANASPQQINALGQFGYNVGIAFQIVDDILDLTADEQQLGKTAGIDIEQGKGFASVQDSTSDLFEAIKDKISDENRVEKAYQQAETLVESAILTLDVVPENPFKTELIHLARSVVNRKS